MWRRNKSIIIMNHHIHCIYTFDIYVDIYVMLSMCHSCLMIFICSLMVANNCIVKCELGVYIFLRVIYICYLIIIN